MHDTNGAAALHRVQWKRATNRYPTRVPGTLFHIVSWVPSSRSCAREKYTTTCIRRWYGWRGVRRVFCLSCLKYGVYYSSNILSGSSIPEYKVQSTYEYEYIDATCASHRSRAQGTAACCSVTDTRDAHLQYLQASSRDAHCCWPVAYGHVGMICSKQTLLYECLEKELLASPVTICVVVHVIPYKIILWSIICCCTCMPVDTYSLYVRFSSAAYIFSYLLFEIQTSTSVTYLPGDPASGALHNERSSNSGPTPLSCLLASRGYS